MKYFVGIMFAVCLMIQPAWAGIEMGQVPKEVVLKGDLGGRLDGSPWSSKSCKERSMFSFM